VLVGCAAAQRQLSDSALAALADEDLWARGVGLLEEGSWEAARRDFDEILARYPDGSHPADARLALADSFFLEGKEGGYERAEEHYEAFLSQYPRHSRRHYAQFQLAECAFRKRRPPDRDQSATRTAMERYSEFLDDHPDSQFVQTAWRRIMTCRRDLALAELQAGRFYQDREAWEGAAARYEGLLADYPDFDGTEEVLLRLAECLVKLGRSGEAAQHLERLASLDPDGRYAASARMLAVASHVPGRAAGVPGSTEPGAVPGRGPSRQVAPASSSERTQAEWDALGISLLNAGLWADAVEHYRTAIGEYPALRARIANLVTVYSQVGRHELAYCLAPERPDLEQAWVEHGATRSGVCRETR